jgi:hypothetical protein
MIQFPDETSRYWYIKGIEDVETRAKMLRKLSANDPPYDRSNLTAMDICRYCHTLKKAALNAPPHWKAQ